MFARNTRLFEWGLKSYWSYYRELEDELLSTRRYVSFSPSNFSTFSIEYLKLLEAACSEVDVLLKVIAKGFDESFDPTNTHILKSWYTIQDRATFPDSLWRRDSDGYPLGPLLKDASCTLSETIKLEPWKGFVVERYQDIRNSTRYRCASNMQVPKWWSDYNKVKHQRAALNPSMLDENYSRANLGNVMHAFAGLYMLEYVLLCSLGTGDDLEGFLDDSVLFTGRAKIVTSRDISEIFGRHQLSGT